MHTDTTATDTLCHWWEAAGDSVVVHQCLGKHKLATDIFKLMSIPIPSIVYIGGVSFGLYLLDVFIIITSSRLPTPLFIPFQLRPFDKELDHFEGLLEEPIKFQPR